MILWKKKKKEFTPLECDEENEELRREKNNLKPKIARKKKIWYPKHKNRGETHQKSVFLGETLNQKKHPSIVLREKKKERL